MLRRIEEGDTKGGIIIPKDKFLEFVESKRRGIEGKIKGIGNSNELNFGYNAKMEGYINSKSWINEVLRINSHIGGINKLEFGYSPLSAMGRPMMNNFRSLKSITMNKKGGASCLIPN